MFQSTLVIFATLIFFSADFSFAKESEFLLTFKNLLIADLQKVADRIGPTIGSDDDEILLALSMEGFPEYSPLVGGERIKTDHIPSSFKRYPQNDLKDAIRRIESIGGAVFVSSNDNISTIAFTASIPPSLYLSHLHGMPQLLHELDHFQKWETMYHYFLEHNFTDNDAKSTASLIFDTPKACLFLEASAMHYIINDPMVDDVESLLHYANYPWIKALNRALVSETDLNHILSKTADGSDKYRDTHRALHTLREQKMHIVDELITRTINYRALIADAYSPVLTRYIGSQSVPTAALETIANNLKARGIDKLRAAGKLSTINQAILKLFLAVNYALPPTSKQDFDPIPLNSVKAEVYDYILEQYWNRYNGSCENLF